MYLVLTQTQGGVSGSLISVIPDKKEGTSGQNLSLHGTSDGNVISLNAGNLTLNGRKEGENILLMFPNNSGIISTIIFSPGSETAFNEIVKNLRDLYLVSIQADQETDKRKTTEKDKLVKLAEALANDVSIIKNAKIKEQFNDIVSALNNEFVSSKKLEDDFAILQHDASVRPMTCYQAQQTVGYDYNQSIGYDYNQDLRYANNQYKNAIKRLEDSLSKVDTMNEKITHQAQELSQAIKQSQFPLPQLKIMPGDELIALEQYKIQTNSARIELPNLKTKNEKLLSKAREIIIDGKKVMDSAQKLVICR